MQTSNRGKSFERLIQDFKLPNKLDKRKLQAVPDCHYFSVGSLILALQIKPLICPHCSNRFYSRI